MRYPLWLMAALSGFFLCLGTALLPSIRLWVFAPFLASLFHQVSFLSALWIGALCGMAMDLFSSQYPFGLFTVTHTVAVFFLYNQKKHFFEDKTIAFCLFSAVISAFLSIACIFCSFFCVESISLRFSDLCLDSIFVSLINAIYAYIWFILPMSLYKYIRRYLLLKQTSQEDS